MQSAAPILILITASPQSRMAYHALQFAQAMQQKQYAFHVFFYQDAVQIANQDLWQPEDELNLTQAWQNMAIDLPVCVSAALSRGVADQDNATRHHLTYHNLASGFQLVGLATLADMLHRAKQVIQF